MSKLVIVESPKKIKSLEKYFGNEYIVMASVGHIVYLPSSGEHRFGVDMKTWEPGYKIDPKKKEIVAKLRAASKKADGILLAVDPDREGEAIAANLVEFLKLKTYQRIRFNEITKEAIMKALDNPMLINNSLVDAQKTRRILDRIIGYKLSSLMRSKIPGSPASPSAGRVQSIALKLVVVREKLIDAFVPIEYFKVNAIINEEISAQLYIPDNKNNKEWVAPEDIENYKSKFSGSLVVSNVKVSKKKDKTLVPLKQSALYKKADSSLGMSSSVVQSSVQRLYEGYGDGGLISYPRTDSTRYSLSFVTRAKSFIKNNFGEDYIASDIKGSAGAQDAHEAIRPTNPDLSPDIARSKFDLNINEYRIYKLIYNHTLSSIMKPPLREIIRYELLDGNINFKMISSKILFKGYFKLVGYESSKELPKMNIGESFVVKKYDVKKHATMPPARYNDGSLIETLDNLGIGRPSTFATTIRILKDREYVSLDGRALVPTEFGKLVIEKLIEAFPNIINEEYTANMETKLDDIALGDYDYKKLLDEFWEEFEKKMQSATQELSITRMLPTLAGKKCPKCNEELVVRRNKRDGSKFFACSNFPECKYTESDPNQKPIFRRKFFKKK